MFVFVVETVIATRYVHPLTPPDTMACTAQPAAIGMPSTVVAVGVIVTAPRIAYGLASLP